MIQRTSVIAVAAVAMLVSLLPASQAAAALKHFDGTVLSKNSDPRSFRITTEHGQKVRFRVNATTEFERIAGGFAGLHPGLKIEVDAKRVEGRLVARQVETSGGGGEDD